MKIDGSEIKAYYQSLQQFLRRADELIEFSHALHNREGWAPPKALTHSITNLITGGPFAQLSPEINDHPLWGLDDIENIERVAALSHVYRLACPTPALPQIWKIIAPAWSTAVLDFCALRMLHVTAGWDVEGLMEVGLRPPAHKESRIRLESEPQFFVASVCRHFTANVRRQLSVARVMLDREASWVYLELRKSRIIEETPDNQPIGDESKLAKVEKAIRDILGKDRKMKQRAIATQLQQLNCGIRTTALGQILRKLAEQGVYNGYFRSPRK